MLLCTVFSMCCGVATLVCWDMLHTVERGQTQLDWYHLCQFLYHVCILRSEIQKGLESMVSCVVKRREDRIETIISDSIQALSQERKPQSQEATTLLQTPTVETVKSDVKDNSVSKTAPQETALDLLDSFGVSTSATDNRKKLKAPKTATTARTAYCGVQPSDLGKKSSSTVAVSNALSESVPESTGGEQYVSDSELTCNVGEIERKESFQKRKKPHYLLSSGEHSNDVCMDDIHLPQTEPAHKDSIREVVSGNPTGGDNKGDENVENCSPKLAVDDSSSCLSDDSVDVSEVKGSNLKMNEIQSKGHSSSHSQRKRRVSSSEGEPQGERLRAKRSRPAVVTTHHTGDRGPLKTKRRGQRLDS